MTQPLLQPLLLFRRRGNGSMAGIGIQKLAVVLIIVWSLFSSNIESHAFETALVRHRPSALPICRSLDCSSKTDLRFSKTDNDRGSDRSDSYTEGLLVLATVPMAWGTFEPAVRLVYKYEPLMPPLLFSFAYYFVATAVLTIGRSFSTWTMNDTDRDPENPSTNTKEYFSSLPLSTQGGIELGTYLFVGNALQVIGLKTVPSDRAAFLLQLTTIFVPLLKSVTTKALISRQTWIACLVALVGVALIGLDDGPSILDTFTYSDIQPFSLLQTVPAFSMDDAFIILAAVFYTFHCVRLETYARSTASAIGLATTKATTEMILSGLVILGCISTAAAAVITEDIPGVFEAARISGEKIVSYGQGVQQQLSSWVSFAASEWPTVGLATVWVGAITVAYTIYAQSFGQSKVSAVVANLIYSSQPIFTATVAYFLLGESLGPNGYIGGLLIGVAVLLVIAAETKREQ